MASTYPTTLDTFATDAVDGTSSATRHASAHNDNADAINKIEREVGTIPGWGPTPRTQPGGRGLLMTSTKLENMPRWGVVTANQAVLVSGTIRVFPIGILRAGEVVSSLVLMQSVAAATITGIWGGIARLSDRVILARSANSTAAGTANTERVFTFAATYTPTVDEVAVGYVMGAATTPPQFYGINTVNNVFVSTPVINGTANTGQGATPLNTGVALAAFTADTEVLYAQLR